MQCKICDSILLPFAKETILKKYEVQYYRCKNCGCVQTEKPYWIEEAYQESINVTDTGILKRNVLLSKITSSLLFFFYDKNGTFLDFAGGYGILTRLMRDFGFDFYWKDKYSVNLVARGFDHKKRLDVDLLTSFESFEHFIDPIDEIEQMLEYSCNILFTTFLLPKEYPKPDQWWYYGLEHGQHIMFYSYETLCFIARKYNLNLYSNKKNIHLLTKKKMNNLLFNSIIMLSRVGLATYVSLMMKSRTVTDMQMLIMSNHQNNIKV